MVFYSIKLLSDKQLSVCVYVQSGSTSTNELSSGPASDKDVCLGLFLKARIWYPYSQIIWIVRCNFDVVIEEMVKVYKKILLTFVILNNLEEKKLRLCFSIGQRLKTSKSSLHLVKRRK